LLLVPVALTAVFALGLLVSSAALAKDGDVIKRAGCSDGSRVKLKLSAEDGRIEVELEVDQNRNGVPWQVRITRASGDVVFAGTRRTRGPSGSFEVRRLTSDSAGPDTIRARAMRASGEVCRVSATFADGGASDDSGGSGTSGASTGEGATSGGSTADDSGSGNSGSAGSGGGYRFDD
jgi:hypothetical protein